MTSSCAMILIVFAIISISSIPSVASLKCYVCDANTNNDCRRNLKSSFIEECKPNEKKGGISATGCAILYSENIVKGVKTSEKNVRRGCYYANLELTPKLSEDYGCDEISTNTYTPYDCFICGEELCNSKPVNGCTKTESTIMVLINLIIVFIAIRGL